MTTPAAGTGMGSAAPVITPDQFAQLTASTMKALVANAKRLGLTWTMHLGTVHSWTDTTTTVVLDGDSSYIATKSMVGVLTKGDRVYVMEVPPNSLYVVGRATADTSSADIPDGSITTAKLADSAVTTIKLADNSVTSAKIVDGTIATGDIADGAVTEDKLANSAVTTNKLADSSVTSAKIVDGTIATGDIANDAVTNAKLANMATQTIKGRNTAGTGDPEDLSATTVLSILGISGITTAWTTWSPTLTNLTLGSGTLVARYKQIGKLVVFDFRFIYGSGSAVGSGPSFTLPVAMNSTTYTVPTYGIGTGALLDAATAVRDCYGSMETTLGTIRIDAYNNTGQGALVTSTSPWTWTTADALHLWGTYEAA